MNAQRSALRAVGVAVLAVGVICGCGGERTVPSPSRADAIATIQGALPDIVPATPASSAAFDKLLKACIAVVRLDDQERQATSPSLSKRERADLHSAAAVCTSDPNRAHTLLQTIVG